MTFQLLRRAAAVGMISLATLGLNGCTIYASEDADWDNDHDSEAHDTGRPSSPPPRSALPISLIGREVRVHMHSPDPPMDGTVRELGEWVRLERAGTTYFIPREHIRYIEPAAPPTTQP